MQNKTEIISPNREKRYKEPFKVQHVTKVKDVPVSNKSAQLATLLRHFYSKDEILVLKKFHKINAKKSRFARLSYAQNLRIWQKIATVGNTD